MKKISTDNPFFDFMGEVGDLIILNIIFIVTSLPVITIGMSMTAMYKVIMRKLRKESAYVAKEYFEACREEWKQSTKIWVILFLLFLLLAFDFSYTVTRWKAFSFAVGVLIFMWLTVFSYIFAFQARFENSIKDSMKNVLYLAFKKFPMTLIIIALNIIPAVCIYSGVFVTKMAIPVYTVIGFSLTATINSLMFNKIFKEFIK